MPNSCHSDATQIVHYDITNLVPWWSVTGCLHDYPCIQHGCSAHWWLHPTFELIPSHLQIHVWVLRNICVIFGTLIQLDKQRKLYTTQYITNPLIHIPICISHPVTHTIKRQEDPTANYWGPNAYVPMMLIGDKFSKHHTSLLQQRLVCASPSSIPQIQRLHNCWTRAASTKAPSRIHYHIPSPKPSH